MKFLITGGARFIGSAVIRFLIQETDHQVLNLDKITYAGNLESLAMVANNLRYQFMQGDICDRELVKRLFQRISTRHCDALGSGIACGSFD